MRTRVWTGLGIGVVLLACACAAVSLRRPQEAGVPGAVVASGVASGTASAGGAASAALEPTPCEKLAKARPLHPRGPLPADPVLAGWTEQMESVADQFLALSATLASRSGRERLDARHDACARTLSDVILKKLPQASELRARVAYMTAGTIGPLDAGRPLPTFTPDKPTPPPGPTDARALLQRFTEQPLDRPVCEDVDNLLRPFPDNPRLRRVLLLHFTACVEDNFSSIDGKLDVNEPLMRMTAASYPGRIAMTFDFLQARDALSVPEEATTWVWMKKPFARITLDLGLTGNALRVVHDLVANDPEQRAELLAVATRRAASNQPSHRRARWAALAAYLEAGTPDPGTPPEPALARALGGDTTSSRWALGYIPNELQEARPRPYPYVKDPVLLKAIEARAQAVDREEDIILALDVVSKSVPGTGLALATRAANAQSPSVWHASIAAMNSQIGQLKTPSEARALFAPHLEGLRRGLGPRICESQEALALLASAFDTKLDSETASCLAGRPAPGSNYLQTLFVLCGNRTFGWSETARALEAIAAPGEKGDYTRRVAHGCKTGGD